MPHTAPPLPPRQSAAGVTPGPAGLVSSSGGLPSGERDPLTTPDLTHFNITWRPSDCADLTAEGPGWAADLCHDAQGWGVCLCDLRPSVPVWTWGAGEGPLDLELVTRRLVAVLRERGLGVAP